MNAEKQKKHPGKTPLNSGWPSQTEPHAWTRPAGDRPHSAGGPASLRGPGLYVCP